MKDVTPHYAIPLAWDRYTTDRELIEEAFERIDTAMSKFADGSAGNSGAAENVTYEHNGETVSVADALGDLYSRTSLIEIATTATADAAAGELLWSYVATSEMTLSAGLVGSKVVVRPLSMPLDMVIRINLNDAPVGTINIVNNIATFNLTEDLAIFEGDALDLVSNDTVTFRSIAVSLLAIRLDQ